MSRRGQQATDYTAVSATGARRHWHEVQYIWEPGLIIESYHLQNEIAFTDMCEILAARGISAGCTFKLGEMLQLAAQIERYGIAGFGWGIAWHTPRGECGIYKRPVALREDGEAGAVLSSITADAVLIHLRRPSRLLTTGLADTQPFSSAAHHCFFAHNGEFQHDAAFRDRYQQAGLLAGRADSEVGFRLFEELLADLPVDEALATVHRQLQGDANLLVLTADGSIAAYAGNEQNALYRFTRQDLLFICTGIHSADDALFQWIFTDARDIQQVMPGESLWLNISMPASAAEHPAD
jgi:predicted glutamine amidotransferase